MAGKFSRKKQEPDASWVLGAVLIALLLAAITLGALWVLRTSRTVGASNAAASQVPAKTDAPIRHAAAASAGTSTGTGGASRRA